MFHVKHILAVPHETMQDEHKSGNKKKIGHIGEEAVANHLKRKGFKVLDRNYLKKWGEIDIVARESGLVRFIEVKTVSREISDTGVARGTRAGEQYRPEENVHPQKLKRLHRAIFSWIEEYNYEGEWQIDVAAVSLDTQNRRATVRMIENVILD